MDYEVEHTMGDIGHIRRREGVGGGPTMALDTLTVVECDYR